MAGKDSQYQYLDAKGLRNVESRKLLTAYSSFTGLGSSRTHTFTATIRKQRLTFRQLQH